VWIGRRGCRGVGSARFLWWVGGIVAWKWRVLEVRDRDRGGSSVGVLCWYAVLVRF
jgi:hypothetical protein